MPRPSNGPRDVWHRGKRPDGTWEVWCERYPTEAAKHLGRFESWILVLHLRMVSRAR
jgi:subtilisin-like proprotein convertase family protein